jgi:phosphohistidine phosphatase
VPPGLRGRGPGSQGTLSDAKRGRNRRPTLRAGWSSLLIPAAAGLDIALAAPDCRPVAIVLDILRHGQALPVGPGGDRQRVLAPAGVRCLTSLAAHLAREAWSPEHVFSSPYVRALESARIMAGALTPAVAVETLRALEPERESSDVLDALVRLGVTAGHILLVGHQPHLGLLVGHLTGVEKGLSPGMLVRVHCPHGMDQGSGRITRTLAPEDLEPA